MSHKNDRKVVAIISLIVIVISLIIGIANYRQNISEMKLMQHSIDSAYHKGLEDAKYNLE